MYPSNSPSSSGLQQHQPQRYSDRHQLQSGGSSKTPVASVKVQQIGEGSYEASRDYEGNIKSYLKRADVKSDARAAKPKNLQEALELEQAEREGLAHSKAPGQ